MKRENILIEFGMQLLSDLLEEIILWKKTIFWGLSSHFLKPLTLVWTMPLKPLQFPLVERQYGEVSNPHQYFPNTFGHSIFNYHSLRKKFFYNTKKTFKQFYKKKRERIFFPNGLYQQYLVLTFLKWDQVSLRRGMIKIYFSEYKLKQSFLIQMLSEEFIRGKEDNSTKCDIENSEMSSFE